jgi:hypothetical protein
MLIERSGESLLNEAAIIFANATLGTAAAPDYSIAMSTASTLFF